MVKSFRELSRIGDANAHNIKFSVGPFAAWVSASARWSVEVPPLICDDQGNVTVHQPKSGVTIWISRDAKHQNNIEIEPIYAYDSVQKVVSAVVEDENKPALATGMVSLGIHARLTLQELKFHDGLGARACMQALSYALHHIKSVFGRANALGAFKSKAINLSILSTLHLLSPFPIDNVLDALMKTQFVAKENIAICRLAHSLNVVGLPLVRLWVEEHQNSLEVKPEQEHFRRLSHLVADVLALSLKEHTICRMANASLHNLSKRNYSFFNLWHLQQRLITLKVTGLTR